jgi:hypothetical protein
MASGAQQLTCICLAKPCVCGLLVPESFEHFGSSHVEIFSAVASSGQGLKGEPPVEVPQAASEDATTAGDDADTAAAETNGSSAAAEPSAVSSFRFMVAPRHLDLGLSRQEKSTPLDLKAQQRAVLVAEAALLRSQQQQQQQQSKTGGKRRGASGNGIGGGPNPARCPTPPSAREALDEDEADIIAAYCDLQLTWDLIEACEEPPPTETGKGSEALSASMLDLLETDDLDVNVADSSGRTSLMAAATAGNTRLVAELVSRGAELDATDLEGRTAFWYACTHGHDLAAAALLDFGALPALPPDVSAVPSPLASAVSGGHAGIVALLLDRATAAADEVAWRMTAADMGAAGKEAAANDDGGDVPSAAHSLTAGVTSQVDASLVAYAVRIDQGEIARALDRFLAGRWSECDESPPGDTVYVPFASARHEPDAAITPTLSVAAALADKAKQTQLEAAISGMGAGSTGSGDDAGAGEPERSAEQGTGSPQGRGASRAGRDKKGDDGDAHGDVVELSAPCEEETTGLDAKGEAVWLTKPCWLDSEGQGPKGVQSAAVRAEVANAPAAVPVARPAASKSTAKRANYVLVEEEEEEEEEDADEEKSSVTEVEDGKRRRTRHQ